MELNDPAFLSTKHPPRCHVHQKCRKMRFFLTGKSPLEANWLVYFPFHRLRSMLPFVNVGRLTYFGKVFWLTRATHSHLERKKNLANDIGWILMHSKLSLGGFLIPACYSRDWWKCNEDFFFLHTLKARRNILKANLTFNRWLFFLFCFW